MKLGFEESQSRYSSGSRSARAWTEAWVSAWAYCPHCGNAKISSFPNNSPLADFFCTSCSEEFELKSQKGKCGTRVVDGAFKTKCERLAASNNPNLFLMKYDLKSLARRQSVHRPKALFRSRDHRGTKATGCHRAARGLDRVQYPAQPHPGVRQDSYRSSRRRSRKGLGARGMAKDAFPQRRIAGDARLVARRHEMRRVARQAGLHA